MRNVSLPILFKISGVIATSYQCNRHVRAMGNAENDITVIIIVIVVICCATVHALMH